jgi:hypothetical protein
MSLAEKRFRGKQVDRARIYRSPNKAVPQIEDTRCYPFQDLNHDLRFGQRGASGSHGMPW